MKILQVVSTYLPAMRYGGPIISVHGLCAALAAREHEVHVFTTNADGDSTLDVPTDRDVALDGVLVHYFRSEFHRLFWSPSMKRALRASVADYDIVHVHAVFVWPCAAAARTAASQNVPYVISPRGMLVRELIHRRSRFVKSAWLRLVDRRNFARAAAIHFTSTAERDGAAEIGLPLPSPFVIPNGIELEPRPDVLRDDRTLLFLGRINWKKGLERVIEFLPNIPRTRLIVAGNDEEGLTPKLRELTNRAGVADRVEFRGPVYGRAKNELLASATAFVLMSQSENFGNAVLEAMAMETPVVLSRDVGLVQDVIRANAGTVGLESIPALLNDPALRSSMGRNGRALVDSRFTWPRIAKEMENTYSRLIESQTGRARSKPVRK